MSRVDPIVRAEPHRAEPHRAEPPGRVEGRVSVVLATYNGARHVAEQMESIFAQTVTPLEVVVGDDGSTDGTVELIRRVASRFAVPVRVEVNERRLGYGENFMRTASRARGEFLAFSDQDDVWYPYKLERALAALSEPEVMLWVGGWAVVDEQLRPVPHRGLHTGFAQSSALAYPMHVAHGARMVVRGMMLDYLPAEGRPVSVYDDGLAHHDEWAVFAAHVLGRVVWDRRHVMVYRRHARAVSAEAPDVASKKWLLSRDGEADDSLVVQAAIDRARFLTERAGDPCCAAVRDRLLRSAVYYDGLVPRLSRRVRTQNAPGRRRRLLALAAAAAHGDYRPLSRGGLGTWNFMQDCYAVAR